MRLLIMGGTVFLGKTLVAEARARGHEITLFNRGVSSLTNNVGVTSIKGDRNCDLSALNGRTWDAVIDTCGYFPRQIDRLLQALAGRIGHYTFVSTVSAYADMSWPGLTETSELGKLTGELIETVTPQTYGPLKAMCEEAAQRGMPGANLIVRPGVIAGPGDPSDRFSYWVARIVRGGEVLAAGRPDAPVQLIDVRDLAAWIISMAEAKQTGTFNTVGPGEPMTMRTLFAQCAGMLNPTAKLVWVDDAFLIGQGMKDWMKLPLYIPDAETKFAGMFLIDGAKAREAGLTLRPLGETAVDTLSWLQTRSVGTAMKTGLGREQELALLGAWKAKSQLGRM